VRTPVKSIHIAVQHSDSKITVRRCTADVSGHFCRVAAAFCTSCQHGFDTAGLAFGGTGLCSHHVTRVDGSCAKHLTVESDMVIHAANSYTYYY